MQNKKLLIFAGIIFLICLISLVTVSQVFRSPFHKGKTAAQWVDDYIKALPDDRLPILQEIVHKIGSKAIPALAARLESGNEDNILMLFMAIDMIIANKKLVLSKDGIFLVKTHKKQRFKGRDWQEAISTLTDLVRDGEPDIREIAIIELGKIGPAAQKALPVLKSLLNDPDAGTRDGAAEAIEEIQK